ncbi:MAG TPA: acyl-CoA thioesterase II [Kineosporiaceae bacterium]|nr:acyl-CoA thioesterase II [Kineosporiaceae bacterium]
MSQPDTDTEPVPEDARHAPPQPSPSEAEALAGLLAVLDLKPEGSAESGDVFVGQSQPQPFGRVYGGQVLSQALAAAQRTVDPDRPVHSLHGYFLRAGDSSEPITFAVERLRDGRSFSARRTQALQFGRPILSMIVSFQQPSAGLDHQEPMPEVPDPESLPTLSERYGHLDEPVARYWLRQRPIDLRHVDPPVFLEPAAHRAPRQCVWMRAVGPLPDDPALHAAVLAYTSDYLMLEPVLRAHGRTFSQLGLKMASLDHAMWWHRPARADEWMLFVQDSPSASGSRGLGLCRVFSRDGRLLCSVAQEGMFRVPPGA